MEDFPSRQQVHTIERESRGETRRVTMLALAVAFLSFLIFGGLAVWQQNFLTPPVRYIEGALDCVSVKGRPGAAPVLSLVKPITLATTKHEVSVRGEGREILPDSPVFLAIYAYSATDGSALSDNNTPRLMVGFANDSDLGSEISGLVIGQTEGSRLLVVRPTVTGETEIDIVDILPVIATGAPVDESPGPLVIEMTENGPKISHSGNPPSGITVQTLLQGEGPQIHAGDVVVAQYFAQNWTDGSVIASTWDEGKPKIVKIDEAMKGLQNSLVDQRVGSRLALTLPPDSGTGEDTLVIVVDILGVGETH